MQKVLIISYFFPPCNLTASQRTMGWAKYLNKFGYYPIVVTRNWDLKIEKPEDVLKSTGNKIKHEKNDQFEVYYLPYKASIRDRFFTRFEGSPLQKLSRIFTFIGLIGENFSTRFIPHRNLYSFSKSLVKNNPDLKKVIISANPFNQFLFGYRLKKKYNIAWVADYRDDWNTTELETETSSAHAIIKRLQKKSEKKWVGTASFITSVSPYYVQKITDFVNVPGRVVLNGYDFNNSEESKTDDKDFIITYNGSLYSTQPIEDLLVCIEKITASNNYPIQIKLQFPGLAFDPIQKRRVENAGSAILDNLTISNRIAKEEVIRMQKNSDMLLMLSHTNTKGIPSSKLYEYIGLQKPVLLYPSDQDILEETLNDVGLGLVANTPGEIEKIMTEAIERKLNNTPLIPEPEIDRIKHYSREAQTKNLADIFSQL